MIKKYSFPIMTTSILNFLITIFAIKFSRYNNYVDGEMVAFAFTVIVLIVGLYIAIFIKEIKI